MHAIDKSSLQTWLSTELEQYGIDSKLYARHILDLFLNSGYTTDLMLNEREKNIFSFISDCPKKSSKLKRKAESRSNSYPCTYDEAVWKKQMALERLLAAADEDVAASNRNNIKDLIERLHSLIKTLSDSRAADEEKRKKKPKENYNDAFPSLAFFPVKKIDVCNTAWNNYKISKIQEESLLKGGSGKTRNNTDLSSAAATKGKDFNANNLKANMSSSCTRRVTTSQVSQSRLSNRERRHPYVKKKQPLANNQQHQQRKNRKQMEHKSNENEYRGGYTHSSNSSSFSSDPPLNLVRHRLPLFEKISQNNRQNAGKNAPDHYNDNKRSSRDVGFSDKICSKLGISRNSGPKMKTKHSNIKGGMKRYSDAYEGCSNKEASGCNLAEDLSMYRDGHKRLPLFRRFCRTNNKQQQKQQPKSFVDVDDDESENKYVNDGFTKPEDQLNGGDEHQFTDRRPNPYSLTFKREKFVYPGYSQSTSSCDEKIKNTVDNGETSDEKQQNIWNHYYLPVSMSSDFMTELPKSSKWFRDPETGFLKFIPASHLLDNDIKVDRVHRDGDRVEIWKYCPSPNLWKDELDESNGGGRASRLETIYNNPSAETKLEQDELIKQEWERYQAIFTDIRTSEPGPNAIEASDGKNQPHQVFYCRRDHSQNMFNPFTKDCNSYILSIADSYAKGMNKKNLSRFSDSSELKKQTEFTTLSDSTLNVDKWLHDIKGKCYEKILYDPYSKMDSSKKSETDIHECMNPSVVTGGVFGSVIHKSQQISPMFNSVFGGSDACSPPISTHRKYHSFPHDIIQSGDHHHNTQYNLFSNLSSPPDYDRMLLNYDNENSSHQNSPSNSGRSSFWTDYEQANEGNATTVDNWFVNQSCVNEPEAAASSKNSLSDFRSDTNKTFDAGCNDVPTKLGEYSADNDDDDNKWEQDISNLQQLLSSDCSTRDPSDEKILSDSLQTTDTNESFDPTRNLFILDYLNEQLAQSAIKSDDEIKDKVVDDPHKIDEEKEEDTPGNRLPCFKDMLNEEEENRNSKLSMFSQKLQNSEASAADIMKLVIDHVLDDEDGNDVFPSDTFDMFCNLNPHSVNFNHFSGDRGPDYLSAVFGIPVPAYECRSCAERNTNKMIGSQWDQTWRLCSTCAGKEQTKVGGKEKSDDHDESFADFLNFLNLNFLNFGNFSFGELESDLRDSENGNSSDILKELNDAIRCMRDYSAGGSDSKTKNNDTSTQNNSKDPLEMLYGCNEMLFLVPNGLSTSGTSTKTSTSSIGDDLSRCKSSTDGLMECVTTNEAWKTRVRISNMWESVSGIRPVDILYNEKQHPEEMVTLQPSALTHFRPIPSNDSSNVEADGETKDNNASTTTTASSISSTTQQQSWLDMSLLKRDNQNVNVEGVRFGCAKCEPGSVENEISDLLQVSLEKQPPVCNCKKKKNKNNNNNRNRRNHSTPNPLADDQLVILTQSAAVYNQRRGEDKCLQTSFERQIQLIDRNLRSELSIRPPKANSR